VASGAAIGRRIRHFRRLLLLFRNQKKQRLIRERFKTATRGWQGGGGRGGGVVQQTDGRLGGGQKSRNTLISTRLRHGKDVIAGRRRRAVTLSDSRKKQSQIETRRSRSRKQKRVQDEYGHKGRKPRRVLKINYQKTEGTSRSRGARTIPDMITGHVPGSGVYFMLEKKPSSHCARSRRGNGWRRFYKRMKPSRSGRRWSTGVPIRTQENTTPA